MTFCKFIDNVILCSQFSSLIAENVGSSVRAAVLILALFFPRVFVFKYMVSI